MNAMLTSAKSSSESLPYSESPRSSISSSFSDSTFLLQRNTQEEEEFVAPINIYHERRSHIEEDKKARTELDTEILDDDLYSPVAQPHEVNNTTSKEFNDGKFNSLFPRFAFSSNSFGGMMESNETANWDYDIFNTNNMFGTCQ